jgi:hypothetical protein
MTGEGKEDDTLSARDLQNWLREEAERLRISTRERLKEARVIVNAKVSGATDDQIQKMLGAYSYRWNAASSVPEMENKIDRIWQERLISRHERRSGEQSGRGK